MTALVRTLVVALFADRAGGAYAADYPAPQAGRLDRARLPLPHRRGDAGAAPALHDDRRPGRRAGAGAARHAGSGRQHADRRPSPASCSAPGQPLDATKYFIILPDAIGAGKSAKPSDGLRAEVPALQLRRHGRGAVPAADRGPRHPAPAPGDRQLDGRHADLDLGRDVSRLHGRAGADGVAADRDVEPQLDDAAHDRSTRSATIRTGTTATTPTQPPRCASPTCSSASPPAAARWPIRSWRRRARRPTSWSTTGWPRRSRRTPTTSCTSGIRRATTTRRRGWSGSRPRCWRSTPPTTSAIRRRPG